MFPGQPGKSHLHQFYGNTSANANSTFASLRASGDSTCNNMGNNTAANRSAYWMPAILDGKGHVVMPDYVQVYYKRVPGSSSDCTGGQTICTTIPNGVRFIQGFNMMTNSHSVQPGWFKCTHGQWYQNKEAMTQMTLSTCPVGSKVEMTMASLKCWNGQLDSPDHMSHLAGMASPTSCPQSHRYLLPQFTISAFFTVGTGDDPSMWRLSSDAMYPSAPRGSTLHFDYFEAWDTLVKDMWVANCVDKKLNCSAGNLGNGKTLRGASQPKYGWVNPTRLVPMAPRLAG